MTLLRGAVATYSLFLSVQLHHGRPALELLNLIDDLAEVHGDLVVCLEERWPA